MGHDDAQGIVAKALSDWPSRLAVSVPALAVLALGITILTGWVTGERSLLLAVKGLFPMVPPTAIGFIVSGVTLFAALDATPRRQRVRHIGATALVLLGFAAATLQVLDVHPAWLDRAFVHEELRSLDAARGRMSLPTALAFVLTGLLALTFDHPGDRLRALLVQLLAGALLALGMVSLIGYDIAPEALVPRYRLGWMPVASAAGFIAIGVALLGLIARAGWYGAVYERHEDEKILILTLGILLLVSLAMSTAGLSLIQRNLERTVRASLAQAVSDRTAILVNLMQYRITRASIVSTRPTLREHLGRWAAAPSPQVAADIAAEGDTFLGSGFNGLQFQDPEGLPIAASGELLGPVPLETPLASLGVPASLLWNQAFYLRARVPVVHQGKVVGHVLSEQVLEVLPRLQLDVAALGRTAEWVLCGAEKIRMACFPHRFQPTPRYAPMVEGSRVLPAALALGGRSGVVNAPDYRGEEVIAGYAPVGELGLGVVLKIDAQEYYAPLREQFAQWWKWLLALALAAALLVSSQVRPVAQRLMASERLARDQAEELGRREKMLRELYSSLGDGIVVMKPDGTIEFTNPAAERLFGFGPGELIGKPVSLMIPEALREANARATQAFLAGEKSKVLGQRGLVFAAQRKDGSTFDIEFSLAEMRQEAGLPRLVAVARDVSEREGLVRLKSEFIAKVSHELRTPLTAIMGSLELLREGDMGEIPEPAKGFIDMAWRNSERLAMLVNDVIDTERIESGALAFRDMEFELGPFLLEAVELNQPYAVREHATLRLVEPVPPAWLRADPDRLMQVMANLLSNAAKFSHEGGAIEVEAERSGERVRVSVTDHGDGIPEEFRPRIFEKFAQADSSDTREVGGTGLGLAICKTIVERLGGEIGFVSSRGGGTTFWFELPASGPPP